MNATPGQSPFLSSASAAATPVPAMMLATQEKAPSTTSTPNPNRCPCCRKKLALMDMACRCGIRHCQSHRLPEAHACTFDFKTPGRAQLTKQLERCVGAKVERI